MGRGVSKHVVYLFTFSVFITSFFKKTHTSGSIDVGPTGVRKETDLLVTTRLKNSNFITSVFKKNNNNKQPSWRATDPPGPAHLLQVPAVDVRLRNGMFPVEVWRANGVSSRGNPSRAGPGRAGGGGSSLPPVRSGPVQDGGSCRV